MVLDELQQEIEAIKRDPEDYLKAGRFRKRGKKKKKYKPTSFGRDLQLPCLLFLMYSMRISSSSVVQGPFFSPCLSQQGALPMVYLRHSLNEAGRKIRKQMLRSTEMSSLQS
ncbi:hypothetical protein NE237_025024 [Protea cynaroides]|uniref:Uncharacterized protein n=1 Tax=Protea cynaroides TaxID=273540 RepID=A0A9Q0H1M8_9MAGN|nr:hypothetical protein NE237_025024 [Protea cynaroides]